MENKIYKQRFEKWSRYYERTCQIYFSPRIIQVLTNNPIAYSDIPEIKSTYFHGKVGTGKTIKAASMLLLYLREQYAKRESSYAEFISVTALLHKIKQTYNSDSKNTEDDILRRYSEIDFLVLDDFGTERTTEWAFQILYMIINNRYENLKTTVYTSNDSLSELAIHLGDARIPSRIAEQCKLIKLTKQYR